MERTKITPTRALLALMAALLMVFGMSAAGHAVTADGNLSDIRALSNALEVPDLDGVTDEPILEASFLPGLACQPNCQNPTGYNIGSMVVAYDAVAHEYYIGLDVSCETTDDTVFGTASVAWDGDGNGDPSTNTEGTAAYLGTQAIRYEIPTSIYTDKYIIALDIGTPDGIPEITVEWEWTASGLSPPQVGPPGVCASAAAGSGPDVEFVISNVDCLGLDECDYYNVELTGFADTDADSAEEVVVLPFPLVNPVRICKLDAQENPVEGWEFRVSVNAGPPDTYVTGADGCVEFLAPQDATLEICEQLPQDALNVLSEVTVNGTPVAPDNPSAGLYCVTVSADDCPVIQFMNECEAEIIVYKYNLEDCTDEITTGSPVEGFVFHITGGGLDEDLPATDAAGMTSKVVAADATYTICETLPQPDASMDKNTFCKVLVDEVEQPATTDTDTWCATVEVGCDELAETHTVAFYNSADAKIKVRKLNLADCEDELVTGTPVEGFEFTITGPGVSETLVTGADGWAEITVKQAGDYTICEALPQQGKNVFCSVTVDGAGDTPTNPDPGVYCATVNVTLEEMNETHEVVFYDACVVDITVCKMNLLDCDPAADPVAVEGFIFHITGPDVDEDLDPTGADGCTSYTAVEAGTYTICEALPQGDKEVFCKVEVDGGEVAEPGTGPWCADVVVSCDPIGESHNVTFYNTEIPPCEIEVCKLDEIACPIEGWTFQLWTGGVKVEEDVTGADGCVTWSELDTAEYVVAEPLPQTVGTKTYTKVDGDVLITDNCEEPPVITPVAATEVLPGIWGVPVDLTGAGEYECCDASPDVSVTFQNTCEVPVTICKYGVESAECDPTAPVSPVASWNFTLKQLPDGPETPYSTGAGGCTDPIYLEPGDYRVCEAMDPIYLFCKLEVNGIETPPSYTEDTNMDGIDDVICYDFTVTCDVETPDEFTFYNAAGRITRTPGYWFTHPAALRAAFECITGSEAGTIYLCEPDGCPVTANDAEAIFWTAKGGNRPTLAKHVLAAMFNDCLLSPVPGTIIEDALAVLCDPEATSAEIGDALGPISDYNESGTEQEMEGFDYGNADPYEAKSMASMGMVPDCAEGKHTKDVTPRTRRR